MPTNRPPYPYTAIRTFNFIADYFGHTHPEMPDVQFEGSFQSVVNSANNYNNVWVNIIWTQFREWWEKSNIKEKKEMAEKALNSKNHNTDLIPIPDEIWEKIIQLKPNDGETPYLVE